MEMIFMHWLRLLLHPESSPSQARMGAKRRCSTVFSGSSSHQNKIWWRTVGELQAMTFCRKTRSVDRNDGIVTHAQTSQRLDELEHVERLFLPLILPSIWNSLDLEEVEGRIRQADVLSWNSFSANTATSEIPHWNFYFSLVRNNSL